MHELGSHSVPAAGESGWRKLAIAYFNGDIDIWMDGTLVLGVTDRLPQQDGTLALESTATQGITSYDNMAICSLNEPYSPPSP